MNKFAMEECKKCGAYYYLKHYTMCPSCNGVDKARVKK